MVLVTFQAFQRALQITIVTRPLVMEQARVSQSTSVPAISLATTTSMVSLFRTSSISLEFGVNFDEYCYTGTSRYWVLLFCIV